MPIRSYHHVNVPVVKCVMSHQDSIHRQEHCHDMCYIRQGFVLSYFSSTPIFNKLSLCRDYYPIYLYMVIGNNLYIVLVIKLSKSYTIS